MQKQNSVSSTPEKISIQDNAETIKYAINDTKDKEVEEEPDVTEELISKGSMSKKLFWKYIRSGASVPTLLCLTCIIVLSLLCGCATDYWLGYWIRQKETLIRLKNLEQNTTKVSATVVPETTNYLSNEMALMIYGLLVLSFIISSLGKNVIFYRICMSASRNLHNSMFSCVLKAPMKFFDSNPSGENFLSKI